ncbi:MAG: transcription antitermination factor NusB [Candidatus Omnitrophica bacterium]|jgi:N utilization substance protein B|nr:transcription antitermination factor NusB [Candidatus Omnitrophota bacterium]
MTIRRKSREDALKILYQLDISDNFKIPINLELFTSILNINSLSKDFTITIVEGVIKNSQFIDNLISKFSLKWKLDRLLFIDKNILRIATYEIWFLPEIPPAVSINEAIEISKKYGSQDSPQFINGLLNSIKEEFEKHEKKST